MSAIYGIINHLGDVLSHETLELMARTLVPYGPDRGGDWIGGSTGLGHRLMAFTPEDCYERQPIVDREMGVVIVADAKIDNRPELAESLAIRASELRELPDSEIVRLSYAKWGERFAEKLIGSFAIALYEERSRRLLLARSPLGARTLYFHQSGCHLVFASRPVALFALPWVKRTINLQCLADYLADVPFEDGATLYEGIKSVSPGTSVVVGNGSIRSRRFWSPDTIRELRLASSDEYREAFLAVFDRSVADSMRSVSPIGVMMSGGLDSASVAASAALILGRQNKQITAYTSIPCRGPMPKIIHGRYADETPFVNEIARMHPNLRLNLIRDRHRFYLEEIANFFKAAEAPFRGASNRMWMEDIYRTAGEQGSRVMLTGTAGNITISWPGNGEFATSILNHQWRAAVTKLIKSFRDTGRQRAFRGIAAEALSLLPDAAWKAVRTLRSGDLNPGRPWIRNSPVRSSFVRDQHVESRAKSNGTSLLERAGRDKKSRTRYFLIDMRNDITIGFEALFGVQSVDPTADLRVVELCLSLPEACYSRGGLRRRVARDFMTDRLPAAVLSNPLRGLQAPNWYESLSKHAREINMAIDQIEHSELARSALDIDLMRKLASQLKDNRGDEAKIVIQYRRVLEKALMTGAFILWVES